MNLYHRVYFTLLLKECLVWYVLGTTHFGPSHRGRTVVADCAMVLTYCACPGRCLLVLFLPRRFVLQEEIKLPWQMRKLNVRKSALLDSKHNLQKVPTDPVRNEARQVGCSRLCVRVCRELCVRACVRA